MGADPEGRAVEVGTLGGVDPGGVFDDPCLARDDCAPPEPHFRRGDASADGTIDVSDALFLLLRLFAGASQELECEKSADTDDSGSLEITDGLFLLNYLFSGGLAPAAPHGQCGPDETSDELGCDRYSSCAP